MLPTHRPTNFFTSIIRRRGRDLTYTYTTTTTQNYAGEVDSSTEDTVVLRTFVAAPDENTIATELGDRYDADMLGLIPVDSPVQTTIEDAVGVSHGYTTEYGGQTYEVEEVEAEPRDEDAHYAVVTFTRKTN